MALNAELQQRCDTIADHLRSRQAATEDEIKACFDQPGDGDLALVFAYGDLRALHAERQPSTRNRGAKAATADRTILDALRGAPKSVTLTAPLGELREVAVHPKSLNVLIELAERDSLIGLLNTAIEGLNELGVPEDAVSRAERFTRAIRELGYQQQLCVWIVTHPGPTLPFPETAAAPVVPEWIGQLSPLDVLLIFAAHHDVNSGRLAALQSLTRARKQSADDVEGGWGVYLANLSTLLNRSAEQLARDYSLASLFAQSYAHGVSQERAMEKANA